MNFSKKITEEFNITLNNTDLKIDLELDEAKKANLTVLEENENEILFNSNSAYPQNLLINISNLQKAIQRSAKNLAVDQLVQKC